MANARSLEGDQGAMDADTRLDPVVGGRPCHGAATSARATFWWSKRCLDVVVSALLLPFVGVIGLFIALANIRFNPGGLFFPQERMGLGGERFTVYKFRSMLPAKQVCRGPEDPVEVDRITPFGAFLRRTRLDETPQLWNVLRGDMSLVGPRPDMVEHAEIYLRTVPLYRRRFAVRPGISGLAQVTSGYAEGSAGAVEKARRDALYIRRACWRLDLVILARTVGVVLTGHGSK